MVVGAESRVLETSSELVILGQNSTYLPVLLPPRQLGLVRVRKGDRGGGMSR